MTGSMSNALDLFVWTKPTTREGLKRLKEFNLFEALLNLLRDETSDFFS